jgi:hypothetical protein
MADDPLLDRLLQQAKPADDPLLAKLQPPAATEQPESWREYLSGLANAVSRARRSALLTNSRARSRAARQAPRRGLRPGL